MDTGCHTQLVKQRGWCDKIGTWRCLRAEIKNRICGRAAFVWPPEAVTLMLDSDRNCYSGSMGSKLGKYKIQISSQDHTVEHLVPSLWCCGGTFGTRTLAGGNRSLGVGLEGYHRA